MIDKAILWANLIAMPVTYYAAKKLVEFSLPAHPMEVDAEILIFVCCFTTIVAVLSVILQTVQAAVANPVDALRYE